MTLIKHSTDVELQELLSTTQRRYHSYLVSRTQWNDGIVRQVDVFTVQCQQYIVLYWLQPKQANS